RGPLRSARSHPPHRGKGARGGGAARLGRRARRLDARLRARGGDRVIRLERLTSIGPREIALRSRQEFSKWIDRILPPASRLVPLGEAAAHPVEAERGFFP